jgi:pyruvate formate lyase activating enzyme
MIQAVLYNRAGNGILKCTACSWYCRIASGRVGVCGTRLNRDGKLLSLVYGRITAPSLDPVEKKPLHHFLPGTTLLSFGTPGCNFGCEFCQNDWLSQATRLTGGSPKRRPTVIQKTIEKLTVPMTPEQVVDLAIDVGAAGIAYTYNEPAIFVEFAHDTARLAKEKGLKNVFVSNGFESKETFEYMKEYLDAINIDLKSFRPVFYQKVCRAKIEPVKENIIRYFTHGIETEVTTLVIPGLNDSDKELKDIATFLVNISADVPWHVSAFSPAYHMTDTPPTPPSTVVNAWEIGKKAGLRFVYTGNISDVRHTHTFCPTCDALLVERLGYDTIVRDLSPSTGRCKKCRTKIYGVYT